MVFAGVRGDGHVVTWGRARYGGDSAAVQEQLRDVQHISSTVGAFATVLVVGGGGNLLNWLNVYCPPQYKFNNFNKFNMLLKFGNPP